MAKKTAAPVSKAAAPVKAAAAPAPAPTNLLDSVKANANGRLLRALEKDLDADLKRVMATSPVPGDEASLVALVKAHLPKK